MLTDLNKEIVDKVEQAIRLGFQIAVDFSDVDYDEDSMGYRTTWTDFKSAGRVLETKIKEMRKAALGQEAA